MTTSTQVRVSLSQADADAMPELFKAVVDNKLWDEVYPHIHDAVIIAAEKLDNHPLSTDPIARAASLAVIGEVFASYLHAGMEAEVSELPDA